MSGMTLPLLPSTSAGGGGGGSSLGDESDNVLRGVPLRQRQLPASFWQEPNVPRYYPPPPMPEYVAVPRPEYSWATVAYAGSGAPDYGYGNATLLQCSCPHCAEKHLRQVGYPWGPDPAFVQPYSTPYPTTNPTATTPLDATETFVGSQPLWKATTTTTANATNAYLPLPYSFN